MSALKQLARPLGVLLLVCVGVVLPATSVREAAAALSDEIKEQKDRRMAWWREAKFGLFIHWGLYAIPAGEWKGKKVRGIGEWIMHHGRIPKEEYAPLQKQFNPVKFNAKQWVDIAKGAGMKYIVITSKHHDGFCLFDSKLTDYDIMGTPFKRDVLKELADECHKQGIEICWYHSIMDWGHPDAKGKTFPKYVRHMRGQLKELLTNYGRIGVLWFDGEWIREWTEPQGIELEKYIRGIQPDLIVNNRVGKRKHSPGDFGTPEQKIPATGMPGWDWETCMTMNNTGGFKKDDHDWKSTKDLIRKLVDIASKGGNFLLNVGPTAEGLIPQPSVERLAAMGRWMDANGQSIYGTTASPFKRLPWGRCTKKPGVLYLHVFDWPADGKLVIPGLGNKVKKVYLFVEPKKSLEVARADENVTIKLPAAAPDPIDTVVVLQIEGAAHVVKPDAAYQWKDLFDGKTLTGWKVPKFGGEGEVHVKDGSIVMETGMSMTGITYTGEIPRNNYELVLEGRRLGGSDFFCTTTCPVGKDPCTLVVGGWGGTVVGLSNVDYYDASDNLTTTFHDFKDKKWYRIRIRVTDPSIEAWIDDEQLVKQERKGHKFGIRFEVELCKPLGISTWETAGAVRNIRLRRLKPSGDR